MHIAAISFSPPVPLPLLSRAVSAGFPSPAGDFDEEEVDLQRLLVTNRAAAFLVRVAGDSMVGKGLYGFRCGSYGNGVVLANLKR